MKKSAIGVAAAVSLAVLTSTGLPLTAFAQPSGPAPSSSRYIVQTVSATAADRVAGDLHRSGGRITHTYSRALAGFSATLTADQAQRARAKGGVISVTADARFHNTTVQNNPSWNLDRIDQRPTGGDLRYDYPTSGAGVTAYVVDTGTRLTHTEFGRRASSGYDFVDSDTNAADCAGHGTHVSGTIGGTTYGVAKAVKLVAVRVLDCDGSGWASDIVDGLDWVIADKSGPSVVNLSLGGIAYAPLDAAVERTVAAGITVVVAAGNDGTDACESSPARAPHAITVAATDSDDQRAWWSNQGDCVDLFAPGVEIESASNSSNTASESMSGTSMASPLVAGVVARYLQAHPKDTPAQVASALAASSTKDVVADSAGAPNRLAYAAPAVAARAPGVPTAVVATRSNVANTGSIEWAAPTANGGPAITGYRVSRFGRDGTGLGTASVTVSASSRTYTFVGLRDRSRYTLSVQAINSVGASPAVSKRILLR